MQRRLALVILMSIIIPRLCLAQWAVLDGTNLVQNTSTALNMVKQVYTSAQQLIAQYNIVRNTITQIENQVKNLQRIPVGLNLIDTIAAYADKIDGLLAQANTLSFELTQAEKDFTRLYQITGQLTAPGVLAKRQELLNARLEASGMAIRMQSVRGNLVSLYGNLSTLLNGSWQASGALDSAQLAQQNQALLLHSQNAAQAMLATSQRLETMRQAEDVVLQSQAITAYTQNTTLAPVGDWRNGPQLEMRVRGRLD